MKMKNAITVTLQDVLVAPSSVCPVPEAEDVIRWGKDSCCRFGRSSVCIPRYVSFDETGFGEEYVHCNKLDYMFLSRVITDVQAQSHFLDVMQVLLKAVCESVQGKYNHQSLQCLRSELTLGF